MRVPQEMVVEQLLVGCETQRGKQAVFDAAPEAQGSELDSAVETAERARASKKP